MLPNMQNPSPSGENADHVTSPLTHVVIESLIDFTGTRFPVREGEVRMIRVGNNVNSTAENARNGEAIEWGGARILCDHYKLIYDGPWPLPEDIARKLRGCGLL